MNIYKENPMESTKKLPKLMSLGRLQDSRKVQKQTVFLYTSNELSEIEIERYHSQLHQIIWKI